MWKERRSRVEKVRDTESWINGIELKSKSSINTHPLKENQKFLCNIVNGQVAPDSVNVQNALQIGEQQSNDFSASLPQGFHETIQKIVKTEDSGGDEESCD